MDTSFDLVALLRQQPTTKSHKIRPTQFVSVAGGVQKRLETNIKNRKYSRLSVFDRIRNISKCESPKASALSDGQQKALHRKQQLEKWKEEKEKKKKEAAAQKKKPFLAGVSQRKTFGPPPPPPQPMPSRSGRVTRSQARQKPEPKPSNTQAESFAPSNATFKPPLFLNTEVPKLAPVNKKKASKSKPNITFEPVLPKKLQKDTRPTRTTRAKPVVNKPIVETRKPNDKTKVNAKTTKNVIQKPPLLKQQVIQSSSSSSDTEQPKLKNKPSLRKSVPPQESTSQDSACVLQDASTTSLDTVSMSSQECNSQDTASMSSQECNSQDTASMTSQDACDAHNASMSSQDACDAHNASMSQETASSQDKLSTPNIKVPKSESGSEEKLRSPKLMGGLTPEQIIEEATNISPCVTMSRGKDNARKEMKKKLIEGILDEDNSNMDSVNHFRQQLNSEIIRITAMCDTWDQIFAQTVLPEPIQELVLTAVGQARLLMSNKLQQFASLIERCAKPIPGTSVVTPADLHGFWDMVFMQVENVDMRFTKLEELRRKNWIEEQKPKVKIVVAKPAAKKAAVKPIGGPSRLREMIAAARKAKKVQESQSENSDSEKFEPTASPETKTFEAGFFRVSSPLKRGSPAPCTPSHNTSLLKSVLSSEANKSVSKNSTSFAMLRASLMSKNVDIEGVSPLMLTPTIPVNLYATPARSILKQTHPHSTNKIDKPKTVLFHDSEEPSSPTSSTSCGNRESGVAPSPADDKENNEIPTTTEATPTKLRHPLSRQNAEDRPSPVVTRSRRKSAQTPLVEADPNVEVRKRSTRKSKQIQEVETPKRSTRRKSAAAV